MKYLVLLIGDGEEKPWPEQDANEQQATMEQFGAFDTACGERDDVQILAGEALAGPSEATVMRTTSGRVTLTEGPYAESVESLGGFYLIQAPDLDVLVELLRVLPKYDIAILPSVDVEA